MPIKRNSPASGVKVAHAHGLLGASFMAAPPCIVF